MDASAHFLLRGPQGFAVAFGDRADGKTNEDQQRQEPERGTVAFLGGSFLKTDMTINSYSSSSYDSGAVMRTPGGTYMSAGSSTGDFNGHAQGTAITTSTPGRVLHAHCQVRITTDTRGVIQDMKIVKDSIGNWTTSWASECFAEERKQSAGATVPSPGNSSRTKSATKTPVRPTGGTHYL